MRKYLTTWFFSYQHEPFSYRASKWWIFLTKLIHFLTLLKFSYMVDTISYHQVIFLTLYLHFLTHLRQFLIWHDTFSHINIIIWHGGQNFLLSNKISYIAHAFSYTIETVSYLVITHFLTAAWFSYLVNTIAPSMTRHSTSNSTPIYDTVFLIVMSSMGFSVK